jgi:DNA polymerase III delta prime subunit
MEINQIIKKIHSEKEGLFLIENNNLENIDLIREEIKNIFYEKQYEIDTCFFELKPEATNKFISIDQIRKLKKEFLHTNVLNLSKVILIKEINDLNNNSINGLLKLIEEVPKKTFFVFCTTNLLKIPKTVLSRSRILRLNDYLKNDRLEDLAHNIIHQNQNISEDLIQNLIDSFISLNRLTFLNM